MQFQHVPAMPTETVDYLNCRPGKTYVDCTLGGSGHALRICEKIQPKGFLIGIDQDLDAINHAQEIFRTRQAAVHIVHANFVQLPDILSQLEIAAVDGILLDLGLSLHQIEASGRGFSFRKDETLEMRMNSSSKLTAADIVNRESEKSLATIFKDYGEERWARRIARKIIVERGKNRIRTSGQLAGIVMSAVPQNARRRQKIHPATRVFMALRIAVNRELENLETFLGFVTDYLNPGGRLCVLAFHSLEDRIVKHRFRALAKGCTCPPNFPQCVCKAKPVARILTRKVVRPMSKEIESNPMARSTRLRALEKI
jgi:16S rRNA (cytosine1402-N4)-methyltransferase